MATPHGPGRALRLLVPLIAVLLAAGVLAMHGLSTGHGLTATAHTAQSAAGHHHGAGAPSLDSTSGHAAGADGDVGSETRTGAGALPTLVAAVVLDHLTNPSPVAAPDSAPTTQRSETPAGAPCQDDCGAHGAVMAMCLAVLAVALALLLARHPAALRQPWTALPALIRFEGRHLVLHRAPGLHQLCVSRT